MARNISQSTAMITGNIQAPTSRLENPMKLQETKRDLARVETILREKAPEGQRG